MTKNKFNNKYSTLESSENTKKYIKEMYAFADKNERKSSLAFTSVAIPILIIFALTLVQMISFGINFIKSDSQLATSNDKSQIVLDNKNITDNTKASDSSIQLNTKVYKYLNDQKNRDTSLNNAKKLNGGKEKGLSTIFMAQVLRDNDYDIDKSVINTKKLISELEKKGWEKVSDYKKLQSGDLCFTTSSKNSGSPAHTYIYMKWVEKEKTDYAYIVDSQVSEYKNTYHKRNIDSPTPKKDKFDFFMRKK